MSNDLIIIHYIALVASGSDLGDLETKLTEFSQGEYGRLIEQLSGSILHLVEDVRPPLTQLYTSEHSVAPKSNLVQKLFKPLQPTNKPPPKLDNDPYSFSTELRDLLRLLDHVFVDCREFCSSLERLDRLKDPNIIPTLLSFLELISESVWTHCLSRLSGHSLT